MPVRVKSHIPGEADIKKAKPNELAFMAPHGTN